MADVNLQGSTGTPRAVLSQLENLEGSYLDGLQREIRQQGVVLVRTTELELSEHEIVLQEQLCFMELEGSFLADFYLYGEHSPQLMAILTAIWAVIQVVIKIVRYILTAIQILDELGVVDYLYEHWAAFRQAVDKITRFLGQVSDTLGWGIDGMLHLVNASNGLVHMASGILGKDFGLDDLEFFNKTQHAIVYAQNFSSELQTDPTKWLYDALGSLTRDDWGPAAVFRNNVFKGIDGALERADEAFQQAGVVVTELADIRRGMPYFVASNIPQGIWDGLSKADKLINDNLLPGLKSVEGLVDELEKTLVVQNNDLAGVKDEIARPGDLLMGVDELSDAKRIAQEAMVDNVAAREMTRGTTKDYNDLEPEFSRLEKVSQALTAPSQQPAFLSLESPGRKAATGIVEEPRETWFVGDF